MQPSLAPTAPLRHNQHLGYDDLRDEAASAIASYDGTQTALAEELGYTRAYISRAKSESGPQIAKVQAEIIERLTPYRLEEKAVVTFRVVRQSEKGSP